jgi:hypothetical protein
MAWAVCTQVLNMAVVASLLDEDLRFLQAVEDVFVQQLVTELNYLRAALSTMTPVPPT